MVQEPLPRLQHGASAVLLGGSACGTDSKDLAREGEAAACEPDGLQERQGRTGLGEEELSLRGFLGDHGKLRRWAKVFQRASFQVRWVRIIGPARS